MIGARSAAEARQMTTTTPQTPSITRFSTARFGRAYVGLCSWLIGGVYLDGWAHNHHQVESFFTPWHGVLYSGFFAVFAFLLIAVVRERRDGATWRRSLPVGYGTSLVGGFVFFCGGFLDLIWHQLFGIEANVEALLSPTHLILALGVFLLVTGPLRAAWIRPSGATAPWTALLSLTYALALLAFFTQFAHPQVITWADRFNGLGDDSQAQALGIGGILVQAGLLTGFILFALRRWQLPPGAVTLVAGLSSLAICAERDTYVLVPAAVAAGLVADALLLALRPSVQRTLSLRVFSAALPVAFYGFYFLALQLTRGVGWTIHLWLGSIVMAGCIGLLLSYLGAPPSLPPLDPSSSVG